MCVAAAMAAALGARLLRAGAGEPSDGQRLFDTQCRACHGLDYRGTVLSKAHSTRSFRIEDRTVTLAEGTAIGCYTCHSGPTGGG